MTVADLADLLVDRSPRPRAPHRPCRRGHLAWTATRAGWRCLTCRRASNLASEKRRWAAAGAGARAKHRARVAKDWWANHEKRLRQHRAAWKRRRWAATAAAAHAAAPSP